MDLGLQVSKELALFFLSLPEEWSLPVTQACASLSATASPTHPEHFGKVFARRAQTSQACATKAQRRGPQEDNFITFRLSTVRCPSQKHPARRILKYSINPSSVLHYTELFTSSTQQRL